MSDELENNTTNKQGDTGADGSIGPKGAQGKTGGKGYQGLQGATGPQGPQGLIGCRGYQGNTGVTGNVGLQGIKGTQGAQGLMGCKGFQGKTGTTGAVGTQGIRGIQGAQGITGETGHQGLQGKRGAQGTKGRKGPDGYMGYQGDTGQVGIQGVMGEKAAVWVDGIRMNGYNVHLFKFDTSDNMFSPETDLDVLNIKNGAVIKIWLDQDAYNYINTYGKIPVNTVVNGTKIKTEYDVYYSDTTPLGDVINASNDIDTVVEITYNEISSGNGAWYYSGGLLTPTITSDITVTGVNVGNYKDGDTVPAGTTIQQLFANMLTKRIDVDAVNPTIKFTQPTGNISNNKTYEIGDNIAGNVSVAFTDGKFVGKEGYSYELAAGCAVTDTAYTVTHADGTVETLTTKADNSADVNIHDMNETTIKIGSTCTYSGSTNTPVDNMGDPSSVTISGGTTNTTLTIYSRYKCYYGDTEMITAMDVDNPTKYKFTTKDSLSTLGTMWLNTSGNTTISHMVSVAGKESFAIVIPDTYDITSTKNKQEADLDVSSTWYKQNKITYTNNGVTTEYQVYVNPSTEPSEYKDIVITKQ